MNKHKAYRRLQEMHESHRISPQTVIAWYHFYSDKLPRMRPENSRQELLATFAVWQALAARGGGPEIPAGYAIDPELLPRTQAEEAALGLDAAAERLQAIQSVPRLRGWVYAVPVAGLLLLASDVSGFLRVVAWAALVFGALAVWAYVDEARKSRRGVGDAQGVRSNQQMDLARARCFCGSALAGHLRAVRPPVGFGSRSLALTPLWSATAIFALPRVANGQH